MTDYDSGNDSSGRAGVSRRRAARIGYGQLTGPQQGHRRLPDDRVLLGSRRRRRNAGYGYVGAHSLVIRGRHGASKSRAWSAARHMGRMSPPRRGLWRRRRPGLVPIWRRGWGERFMRLRPREPGSLRTRTWRSRFYVNRRRSTADAQAENARSASSRTRGSDPGARSSRPRRGSTRRSRRRRDGGAAGRLDARLERRLGAVAGRQFWRHARG